MEAYYNSGMTDSSHNPEQDGLIQHALDGDEAALANLFERHRGRLRKMVDLRMDRRIRGRINPSDILQEAFIDLANQLPDYKEKSKLPFFVWVRWITGQRLAKVHHFHLDAEKRNAAREMTLYRGRMPQATSMALASQLIGNSTSAAGQVMRAERQLKLQDILNGMDEDDREVLAMRYFEQLSNSEIALILEVSDATAGMRHLRALRRLQNQLRQFPNLFGDEFDLLAEAQERAQTDKGDDA